MAIRAFNVEIAKSADRATDFKVIEMRLMWWKSSLAMMFAGKPPEHPVAEVLCDSIYRFGLKRELLESVINNRIKVDALPPNFTCLVEGQSLAVPSDCAHAREILGMGSPGKRLNPETGFPIGPQSLTHPLQCTGDKQAS